VAEFVRLPADASVTGVKRLLNEHWGQEVRFSIVDRFSLSHVDLVVIQRPSLVISLTGGAKDYNMKPSMLSAFRRGLLKVVRTTGLMNEQSEVFLSTLVGAWVITGGMNTGIMKLVGETIQMNPDRTRPIRLIVSGTGEMQRAIVAHP
jgi:transient receptor potential cation channel subfamily M member 2